MFSDNDVELSDIMSTCQIFMLTCQILSNLSDNFVVICMTLTGQEHVFKIYYIKIWQDDIKIRHVSIIIWQVMAEKCHHSHLFWQVDNIICWVDIIFWQFNIIFWRAIIMIWQVDIIAKMSNGQKYMYPTETYNRLLCCVIPQNGKIKFVSSSNEVLIILPRSSRFIVFNYVIITFCVIFLSQ